LDDEASRCLVGGRAPRSGQAKGTCLEGERRIDAGSEFYVVAAARTLAEQLGAIRLPPLGGNCRVYADPLVTPYASANRKSCAREAPRLCRLDSAISTVPDYYGNVLTGSGPRLWESREYGAHRYRAAASASRVWRLLLAALLTPLVKTPAGDGQGCGGPASVVTKGSDSNDDTPPPSFPWGEALTLRSHGERHVAAKRATGGRHDLDCARGCARGYSGGD
jgi:hypothetical protein